jgi:hypothetical protein
MFTKLTVVVCGSAPYNNTRLWLHHKPAIAGLEPQRCWRSTILFGSEARGSSNKQIANRLGMSLYTANAHIKPILSKSNAPNRTAATRYAFEHHLA